MKTQKLIKSSGEFEDFSEKKLLKSIKRAGGDEDLAKQIISKIKQNPEITVSTNKIHEYVFDQLKKSHRPIAARYNMRRAITDLGPTGYPFEQFVAQIFITLDFKVKANKVLAGKCVKHEVDLIVKDDDTKKYLVEAKFHNKTGYKSNVKVPLYVHSRFNDVNAAITKTDQKFTQAWIVTNTKFSKDAIQYANCSGIRLLAWNYPKANSLSKMIDQLEIHPITALTSINNRQKQYLIDNGLVLCRQLQEKPDLLRKTNLSPKQITEVIIEARDLCKFGQAQ